MANLSLLNQGGFDLHLGISTALYSYVSTAQFKQPRNKFFVRFKKTHCHVLGVCRKAAQDSLLRGTFKEQVAPDGNVLIVEWSFKRVKGCV